MRRPAARRARAGGAAVRTGLPRAWRRLAMGLGLLVAVMLGISGELVYSSLTAPTARPSPTRAAVVTASPRRSATPGPTATPTVSPSASSVAVPTSPYATVTFRDLMLETLPNGKARTFTFSSDGPGTVSAEIVAAAPLNGTRICLSMAGGSPTCSTGVTPAVSAAVPAPGQSVAWTATVIGTKSGTTPVVDVAFVWPSQSPSLTISQARFQGVPNPEELRGFTARFQTRSAGTMQFDAHWAPVTANAAIILLDVTGTAVVVNRGTVTKSTGTNPPYAHSVDANHIYQIQLLDTSADTGHPNLIATISFP